ncbi:MAG: helix-turn-helix domain-containing protein [Eubacteriaceae bacterium]
MINLSFSQKLKILRKREGLSQEKLAEELKVSRQAVSKWESGYSYPEIDKLIVLSDLFKISLDDLVKDKNEKKFNTDENEEDCNTDENEEYGESLVIGGFIIGIAIGFATENFMLGTVGGFIGLGLSYIITGVKNEM